MCRSFGSATSYMMSESGSISGVEEKVSKTTSLRERWDFKFVHYHVHVHVHERGGGDAAAAAAAEKKIQKIQSTRFLKSRVYYYISIHSEMSAIDVHQFAECITCHAWSPDRTMVAICPNSTEVHIYRSSSQEQWERVHVLQKHDQIVSGIDWSSKSNKIVTVSHDRNSYVWNQEGSEWVPTLVILRLNRAALCVQWSPKENKFAVGSGAKTVCICYYEQENNWWVSKLIRKRHNSSVTSVAWHPNNILLATTSTDGKCRIFSTFIKGVDSRDPGTGTGTSLPSDAKFGEQIVQLDLCFSWAFGVKWSPSGNILAYVGHNSMIYFIEDVGPSPSAQSVAFRDLPLRDVLFVSEKVVIGVGFDYNPMVFTADESGLWSFVKFLDERKTAASSSKYGSQFSEAFGKLYGQSKPGTDAAEHSRSRGGVHHNCINCIVPLKKAEDGTVKHFSTSGVECESIFLRQWSNSSSTDGCDFSRIEVWMAK